MNHPMDASTTSTTVRNDDAAASTVEHHEPAVTAADATTAATSVSFTVATTAAESFTAPPIPIKNIPELPDDTSIVASSVASTVATPTSESLKAPPVSVKIIQELPSLPDAAAAAAAAAVAVATTASTTKIASTETHPRKKRQIPTAKMSAAEVFKILTIPPKIIPDLPSPPHVATTATATTKKASTVVTKATESFTAKQIPPKKPPDFPSLSDASTATNEASTAAMTAPGSFKAPPDLPLPSELKPPPAQPPSAPSTQPPHPSHPPYHHAYCYPPAYYYGYHYHHYSVHPPHHPLHYPPPPYPPPPQTTSHDSTMDGPTAPSAHNEATPEGVSSVANQTPSSWMDTTDLPHIHNNHHPHHDTNQDVVSDNNTTIPSSIPNSSVNGPASLSPTITNSVVRTTGASSGVASTNTSMGSTTLATKYGPRLPVQKQKIQPPPPNRKQQPQHLKDNMTARTPIRSNTTSKATKTGRGISKLSGLDNSTTPKKKMIPVMCRVTKPVVMVDQLTYDWSSLKLNGTPSWNQLLQSSSRDSKAEPASPQVTALHTYQLMKHLKESLFVGSITDPPPDSKLQYHLHLQNGNKSNNTPETGPNDNSGTAIVQQKVSTPHLIPTTDNCPEEMRPLYASAATFYQKLTEERKKFHHEQQSQHQGDDALPPPPPLQQTLKDRYRLLTATELRQYVQQTKREIASLNRYEQRVLQVAKRLLLHPSNASMGKYDKDNIASHPQPPPLINQDDEIRRRYHKHFRKKRSYQPSPQNESSNTSTTTQAGPSLLWQDDDISTLFFKKHKS